MRKELKTVFFWFLVGCLFGLFFNIITASAQVRLGDPGKQVQGTLGVVNGGTGRTTVCANNEIMISNGTTWATCIAISTHTHTKSQITDFAHETTHRENASDELTVENLGTACSAGQTGVSDGAGGLSCGSAGSAVPTGTQGQKLSYGATGTPYATEILYLPEDFGAEGDGSTDDTVALQAAVDAACNGGDFGILLLTKTYKTTATVTLDGSNCKIHGGGTISPIVTSGTVYGLLVTGSGPTTTTGSATTVSLANAKINVTPTMNFDSVTGFAVDDWVSIGFNNATQIYNQISRIQTIVSTTVTFVDPILIPLDAGEANTVNEFTPIENIHIENIKFEGIGCTSTSDCQGLRIINVVYSTFKNIRAQYFDNGAASLGVIGSNIYGSTFDDITLLANAEGNNTSDIWLLNTSNSTLSNIKSYDARGFGPQCSQCTQVQGSNISVIGSIGRGFKLAGVTWSSFTNVIVNENAHTGLSITNGAYRNFFVNVIAHRNLLSEGLWFSGQENDYNTITNFVGFENTDYDLAFNSTDSNNVATGVSGDNFRDLGESNQTVLANLASGVPTVATVLVNGANHNVPSAGGNIIRITGPSADFSITGFADPIPGKILYVQNTTALNMTVVNNSGSSSAANRIVTNGAADIVSVGIGSVTLMYDGFSAYWRDLSARP